MHNSTTTNCSLADFPSELIIEISKYCNWEARRALSLTNRRLNRLLAQKCSNLGSLSIKGNENVENYFVSLELDGDTIIRYNFKLSKNNRTKLCVSIDRHWINQLSSREKSLDEKPAKCAMKLMMNILEKCHLKMIHIGLYDFVPLLDFYQNKFVDELAIGDSCLEIEHVYRLHPTKLTLFQQFQSAQRAKKIDVQKLRYLRKLHLFVPILDFEDFLKSNITTFISYDSDFCLNSKQINKIIENWKSGRHNYQQIDINRTIDEDLRGIVSKNSDFYHYYVTNCFNEKALIAFESNKFCLISAKHSRNVMIFD